MTNAITNYRPMTLQDTESTAEIFAKSGMFSDSQGMAQAFVKIMAGAAMGFDPFSSMNGIHIIQGKPSMGAGMIAAAIDRHPGYDFDVIEHTDKACTIRFLKLRGGEWVNAGESSFTWSDATKAKEWNKKKSEWVPLANKNTWKSYPRNMLYARAMSNGARWYCPGIFGGSVYVPEELGAEVNGEGDIIEGHIIQDPQYLNDPALVQDEPTPPAKTNGNSNGKIDATEFFRKNAQAHNLTPPQQLEILGVKTLDEWTQGEDAAYAKIAADPKAA